MNKSPMTKEEVYQKIREILSKDKRFNNAVIKINFTDKQSLKATNK